MESMIAMGGFSLPAKTVREIISGSIDVIIQAARLRDGSRRTTNITEVIGMEGDVIVTQELFKFEYLDETDDGKIIEFHDRKLDALEDIIEAANGKPLLVAYWFRHDLERIRRRFNVREIKTSADIADWNAGNIPVAVIHPASAGHGLNLQAGGSTLVWFGLTWSLELYQQTNARLWRQGQESRTVVIQHIIAANTIDGQILDALKRKDKTQAALIAAVKAVM